MERSGRFVIQEHTREGQETHWDLMLEHGEVLESYRLGCAPGALAQQAVRAERIFDHPLRFLRYEGAVNEGKGNIRIAEAGRYESHVAEEGQYRIIFEGEVLRGEFRLVHVEGRNWEIRGECS